MNLLIYIYLYCERVFRDAPQPWKLKPNQAVANSEIYAHIHKSNKLYFLTKRDTINWGFSKLKSSIVGVAHSAVSGVRKENLN